MQHEKIVKFSSFKILIKNLPLKAAAGKTEYKNAVAALNAISGKYAGASLEAFGWMTDKDDVVFKKFQAEIRTGIDVAAGKVPALPKTPKAVVAPGLPSAAQEAQALSDLKTELNQLLTDVEAAVAGP